MSAARSLQSGDALGGRGELSRRRVTVAWLVGGCAALLGAAVLFWFDPTQHTFYPACAFHQATGLLCPGCGSTRAMHQLLHGHLVAALHFNAFFVCSLPLLGWLGLRFAMLKFRDQPATINIRPFWLWSLLVALVIFGIVRNLPFG
jgi:hypothetical protein